MPLPAAAHPERSKNAHVEGIFPTGRRFASRTVRGGENAIVVDPKEMLMLIPIQMLILMMIAAWIRMWIQVQIRILRLSALLNHTSNVIFLITVFIGLIHVAIKKQ